MSTVGSLEQPVEPVPQLPEGDTAGAGPWTVAGRRLLRNRVAMAALALFLVILLMSMAAPLYASHIAHTDPFTSGLTATTVIDGKKVDVLQQGGGVLKLGETPIGPTWSATTSWAPTTRAATWPRGCSTAAAPRSRSASARP